MKWSGFVVLLIVPLAFVMIFLYALLETRGILNIFRNFVNKMKSLLEFILK
jgi:hypothetical protein